MSLSELLKEQLEKRMESWNRQIDAEEAKARARQAAAEADASSAELEQQLWANAQELRAKVQEGKNFLDELTRSGEDKAEQFKAKLRAGMAERGYTQEFADALCRQIEGFGEYGFPESHAASFALLAYASAWLKWHEPEAFLCALLNSQPMGFYRPAQLVHDAQRHGVRVRPVDITRSTWDGTLEATGTVHDRPAVRLGLREINGLSHATGSRIATSLAALAEDMETRAAGGEIVEAGRISGDVKTELAWLRGELAA